MISVSTRNKIEGLLRGETVPYSALSAALRDELLGEQLLSIQADGSHRRLYAPKPDALRAYLSLQYEEWRAEYAGRTDVEPTRAALAAQSGNSKLRPVRACPGFLVNSYEPIAAWMDGQPIMIAPPVGTMCFIADWQHFRIDEEVVVVGVENMENFRRVAQQRYLFASIGKPVLFVARYPQSLDLRHWLERIPNRYIHFGDFDLAGMHIYEREFRCVLGDRASFFIPDDIEQRIANGSTKRYNAQMARYRSYTPEDPLLLPLFRLLHRYHRAYDQEGYIRIRN